MGMKMSFEQIIKRIQNDLIGQEFYTVHQIPKTIEVEKKCITAVEVSSDFVYLYDAHREHYLLSQIYFDFDEACKAAEEKAEKIRKQAVEIRYCDGKDGILRKVVDNPDETIYECSVCGHRYSSGWSGRNYHDGMICKCGAKLFTDK